MWRSSTAAIWWDVGTSSDRRGLTVGIDLRRGGGISDIVEVLKAADPAAHGIGRVVVWGGKETIAALPERTWLEKGRSCRFGRRATPSDHVAKAQS